VFANYKERDFGEDYEVTKFLPEGRCLCNHCAQMMIDGALLTFPKEHVIPSRAPTIRGDKMLQIQPCTGM
jgi:hypothetical protein